MGLNFKEKFQNMNTKRIAIISIILFIVAISAVFGYEYFQMKQVVKPQAVELQADSVLVQDADEVLNTKPVKPSDYKIGIEYNEAIKAEKPVVVLFYADWCRYCIGFMPTFQTLSRIYKDKYNFSKVNIEDPKYEKVVKNADLTGFPTVYLIDPKYDNKVLLSNATFSDLKKIRVELDRFVRIRSMLDKK